MKKLMTLIFAVSAMTTAQAQDRTTMEAKLLKATSNLQRAVDRNLTIMTDGDLREALRATRNAIRAVRGQGGGGNGGGGHFPAYVANVKFESNAFLLQASDVHEFKEQCLVRAQQTNLGNIDDIYLSFNGAPQVKKHTSGWWTTNDQKCGILTGMILDEAFKQGIVLSRKRYVMTGDADGQGLFAEGNNIFELEQSCTENLNLSGNVDDVRVRLNGGELKTSHTGGWWTTAGEVCRNAVSTVFR
ncbi:MAG: hypothetical protein CME70_12195 [Halobacteriovorax sp.]|nr:hypothetical protein [Halobacteriovorax sp.]